MPHTLLALNTLGYYMLAVAVNCKKSKGKGRYSSTWGGTPPQSYGTSLAISDHSVTCHPVQVKAPRLTPAM